MELGLVAEWRRHRGKTYHTYSPAGGRATYPTLEAGFCSELLLYFSPNPIAREEGMASLESVTPSLVLLPGKKLSVAVIDAMPIKVILTISISLAHSLFLACNTATVLSGH